MGYRGTSTSATINLITTSDRHPNYSMDNKEM